VEVNRNRKDQILCLPQKRKWRCIQVRSLVSSTGACSCWLATMGGHPHNSHSPCYSPNTAARHLPILLFFLLDLFNKISHTCFNKCASRKHREPDLALGEMTCTDRCVSKYLESQQRVGAVLQEANEQQLQQQKSMMEMQSSLGGK